MNRVPGNAKYHREFDRWLELPSPNKQIWNGVQPQRLSCEHSIKRQISLTLEALVLLWPSFGTSWHVSLILARVVDMDCCWIFLSFMTRIKARFLLVCLKYDRLSLLWVYWVWFFHWRRCVTPSNWRVCILSGLVFYGYLWAFCHIHKIVGWAYTGNARNDFTCRDACWNR